MDKHQKISSQDKIDILKMRRDGMTNAKIAEIYGVDTSSIRYYTKDTPRGNRLPNSVMPGVDKWMDDNHVSIQEFADMVYVCKHTIVAYKSGRTAPSLGVIQQMLKVTGLTFDEAFGKEEK